jgi:hypothetical protein
VTAHDVLIPARKDDDVARLHRRHRMVRTHDLARAVDEDMKEDDAFGLRHDGRRQHLGHRRLDRPR